MTTDDLFDCSSFAIWELRAAFERKNDSKVVANCRISAASDWMIRSGRAKY
jgi:uncharacterized protein DUF3632